MKAAVFISYALSDAATADQVRLILHESGVSCWIAPREAQPGETWVASIDSAMSEVKAVLLLFSSAANTSRHVARELQLAEAANIPTLCVRIDQAEPSGTLQYFLAHAPRLGAPREQLSSGPLRLELVNAVKALVESPSAAQPNKVQSRRSKYLVIAGVIVFILLLIGALIAVLWNSRPLSRHARNVNRLCDGCVSGARQTRGVTLKF